MIRAELTRPPGAYSLRSGGAVGNQYKLSQDTKTDDASTSQKSRHVTLHQTLLRARGARFRVRRKWRDLPKTLFQCPGDRTRCRIGDTGAAAKGKIHKDQSGPS